jgi:virginiamycin A acetyltransferase
MKVTEQAVYWLLIPLIYPLVWATKLAVRHSQRPRVWYEFFSELLSLVPFDLGILARRMFYERTLDRCGRNLCVRFGAVISYPGTRVGDNVLINRYSIVGLADIGHNVMIANHCSLLSGRYHHRVELLDIPMREQGAEIQRVHVGDDVWIGANAVVMADVGAGSVIGAGAVVICEIAPYSVAVGNPAKVVRRRDEDTGKVRESVLEGGEGRIAQ